MTTYYVETKFSELNIGVGFTFNDSKLFIKISESQGLLVECVASSRAAYDFAGDDKVLPVKYAATAIK